MIRGKRCRVNVGRLQIEREDIQREAEPRQLLPRRVDPRDAPRPIRVFDPLRARAVRRVDRDVLDAHLRRPGQILIRQIVQLLADVHPIPLHHAADPAPPL